MNRLPPLKSLQFFLTAAKQPNFKSAAHQLHVTQAAVSQQIKLLEQHLQCQLFERNNKTTQLTEQGQHLFPYIEQAFEYMHEGVSSLLNEPEPDVLKISSLHSFTTLWLMPRINEFQQENPDLNVHFLPSNALLDFKNDNVDITIRRGMGKYAGLTTKKLLDDEIILVVSPLLITAKAIDIHNIDHIMSLPLLEDLSEDIQEALHYFYGQHAKNEKHFSIALKTTDSIPIIDNVLGGKGLAFVSKTLVEKHLRQKQLVQLVDFSHKTQWTLYLVAPAHHYQWRKIKRFEQWIMDEFNRQ